MTWVRIDEEFYQHPKVAAAGPLALALQVAALCYCNRNLTDGFIPWGVARSLLSWEFLRPAEADDARGPKVYKVSVCCGMSGDDVTSDFVTDLMCESGLWEQVDGGFRVHDYLDYQPSKAEVLQMREQRAEAGRAGGNARAKNKRDVKQPASDVPSKCSSKTLAKLYPGPVPVPVPGSDPDPGPDPGPEGDHPDAPQGPAPSGPGAPEEDSRRTPGGPQDPATSEPKPKRVRTIPVDPTNPNGLKDTERIRRFAYLEWQKSHGAGAEYVQNPEADDQIARRLLDYHRKANIKEPWEKWVQKVIIAYYQLDDSWLRESAHAFRFLTRERLLKIVSTMGVSI